MSVDPSVVVDHGRLLIHSLFARRGMSRRLLAPTHPHGYGVALIHFNK